MTQSTQERRRYRLELLEQAQKLLRDLPPKDTRKTRKEAMDFLQNGFLKAIGKGYTPRELVAFLKENNVTISVQLIEDALGQKEGGTVEVMPSPKDEKDFEQEYGESEEQGIDTEWLEATANPLNHGL